MPGMVLGEAHLCLTVSRAEPEVNAIWSRDVDGAEWRHKNQRRIPWLH